MNRFDNMSKDAMARVEEIMNSTKLNEFLHRKEEEEKKKTCILWVLAIIGVVAAVAAIAYGVYRFFTPDYLTASQGRHTSRSGMRRRLLTCSTGWCVGPSSPTPMESCVNTQTRRCFMSADRRMAFLA